MRIAALEPFKWRGLALPQEAIPALIRALDDTNDEVKGEAASVLGEIGPGAEEALLALQKMVSTESSWFLRKEIKKAINKIIVEY